MIPRRNARLKFMLVVVSLWLLMSALLLLTVVPWRPATPLQWLLFIVLGPPICIALEYLGDLILSPKLGARISPRHFSWLRIGYSAVAILICLVILYGVLHFVGNAMAINDA